MTTTLSDNTLTNDGLAALTVRKVYLNGRFTTSDSAFISPFDRGFIFGDGVYEVIPVYGGRLFRLEQHLQRLENSMRAIRLHNPMDRGQWTQMLDELTGGESGCDQSVYIQVTRGVAPRDHGFPLDVAPTVFAYAQRLNRPSPAVVANGIAAITLDDIRWQRCDIKATALLANILLRQQAMEQGAAEAILVRDGNVTEGAASNIFVVLDGCVQTPPKDRFLLPGITRDVVLELARANGIPCREAAIPARALAQAGEVWMTSSTKELLAVTILDGKPVADGRPGELFGQMRSIYERYVEAFRQGSSDLSS